MGLYNPMSTDLVQLLDNPVWESLTGPHAHLAEGTGLARRYPRDVSVFHALADAHDPRAWADLGALIGDGGEAMISGDDVPLPVGWTALAGGTGVQLVETPALQARHDPVVERLDGEDPVVVAQMLDLVARTRPGPFLPGTPRLGAYLGVRDEGRLVALAGERLHPAGWTEISAVCTDPAHRGRGLATTLVLAVAAGIQRRGERALMHAAIENADAIRLYLSLGFALRRETTFRHVRAPRHLDAAPPPDPSYDRRPTLDREPAS